MTAARRSKQTIRLRIYYVTRFARHYPLETATTRQLEEWFNSHTWADDTARSARSSLAEFYRWAIAEGLLGADPTARLERFREGPGIPRPVPEEIYRERMLTAESRVALAIQLAGEAGLRRAEAAQLHTRDVVATLAGPIIRVHGKGGKIREVPIAAALARRTRAACQEGGGWAFPGRAGHLTPGHLGRLVSQELGPGYAMHGLRHRFATICYAHTGDLVAVQKLMGHSSIKTTLRYIRMDEERLRAVALMAA